MATDPEPDRGGAVGASQRGNWIVRALESLGLTRPELRAWALYDWANSAFFTTVVAAVFPVFYRGVAAKGRTDVIETYAEATSYSMLAVALVGPLLGAVADVAGRKKTLLAAFLTLGVLATAGMFFLREGDWLAACWLFALGNIGVAGSFIFYDALLPAIARDDELDRVSSAAYSLGYLGGGVLLALNVAWILNPQWFGLPHGDELSSQERTLPTRLAFLSVAVWWFVFSLPLLRRVREPARVRRANEPEGAVAFVSAFVSAARRLRETFRELRRWRQAFLFLIAMLIYGDGIVTIIRMAVVFGGEIDVAQTDLILAILLVQIVGAPCAVLFGKLAQRIGAKRAILCGLGAYVGVSLIAFRMQSARDFYALALGVGAVQGGCQALSRSLFASMAPAHKSGEFFGLYGVLDRFASILGPLAFAATIKFTGETRNGALAIAAFFVVGGAVLCFVDVDAGRRAARELELEPEREI
jgi:UMF1 family MFS transporter